MASDWLAGGRIYQMFLGRWQNTPITTQVLKTLHDYDWGKLKEWGFSAVYLLGVWDYRCQITVQEEEGIDLQFEERRVPSMMGLIDHTRVNPWLGTQEEFNSLIDQLHAVGLRVIVDFVPAHTSIFHPWVELHPDYYCQDNGQIIKTFSGDVAKLNYDVPQLRDEMTNILNSVARLKVDGVRCDMAHLIPQDFWKQSIQSLKSQYTNFVFIAEAYPESRFDYSALDSLFASGFDGVYDNGWYENLNSILVDGSPVSYLTGHMQFSHDRYGQKAIFYAGNHDDPPLRHRSEFDASIDSIYKNNLEAIVALLCLGNNTTSFFYNGSLHGYSRRLAHHWLELLPTEVNELETPLKKTIDSVLRFSATVNKQEATYSYNFEQDLLEVRCDDNHSGGYRLIVNLKTQPFSLAYLSPPRVGLIHGYGINDSLLPGEAEVFTL